MKELSSDGLPIAADFGERAVGAALWSVKVSLSFISCQYELAHPALRLNLLKLPLNDESLEASRRYVCEDLTNQLGR